MKALVTVTVEASAHHDMEQAEKILAKAIDDARMRINNGTRIKRSFTNADDPKEMMGLMGQLKWWTLGKTTPRRPEPKREGLFSSFLREVGKQAKEIYNYDPEKELK